MNINILQAKMSYNKEDGYVGSVHFEVEGHANAYEIALQSKRGTRGWGYGLFFLNGSGNEDDLILVEDEIEENDEFFDMLVAAGKSALAPSEKESLSELSEEDEE